MRSELPRALVIAKRGLLCHMQLAWTCHKRGLLARRWHHLMLQLLPTHTCTHEDQSSDFASMGNL